MCVVEPNEKYKRERMDQGGLTLAMEWAYHKIEAFTERKGIMRSAIFRRAGMRLT